MQKKINFQLWFNALLSFLCLKWVKIIPNWHWETEKVNKVPIPVLKLTKKDLYIFWILQLVKLYYWIKQIHYITLVEIFLFFDPFLVGKWPYNIKTKFEIIYLDFFSFEFPSFDKVASVDLNDLQNEPCPNDMIHA